jgi:hypothetical protein
MLSDIVSEINFILKNRNFVQTRAATKIRINRWQSREPDAHIIVMGEEKDNIVAVLESAYSETATTSLEEFQDELSNYFVICAGINVVIGVFNPFIAPGIPRLAVPLSMSLIVLHRGNGIAPQVIQFGEDAGQTDPVLFTILISSSIRYSYLLV